MPRFQKLSSKTIELFSHAQHETSGIQMGCPKCRLWFNRDDVTKTRAGRYVPGRYQITCPLCDESSPAGAFSYYYPEQNPQYMHGSGVRLDGNETAMMVNPNPPPGSTTIV